MNRWIKLLMLAGAIFALSFNQNLQAQATGNGGQRGQGRRQRDPAQAMAQRMDRYRQDLEISSDEDWKALQPLIEKVVAAQGETRLGNVRGQRGQRNRQNGSGNSTDTAGTATAGRNGGTPNPEADTLRQAVSTKAPGTEISAKLAKLRETQVAKQAKLDTARENLRKVLSVRQEAIAVTIGLLK